MSDSAREGSGITRGGVQGGHHIFHAVSGRAEAETSYYSMVLVFYYSVLVLFALGLAYLCMLAYIT